MRVAQYRMLLIGESRYNWITTEYPYWINNIFVSAWLLALLPGDIYFFHSSTDYLNNLSPDSKEYEDTQGTINMLQEQTECAQRLLRPHALSLLGEPYVPSACVCWEFISTHLAWGGGQERANLDVFVCGGNPLDSRSSSLVCRDGDV